MDVRLKRKYPRTSLPDLKLSGVLLFNHKTKRQSVLLKNAVDSDNVRLTMAPSSQNADGTPAKDVKTSACLIKRLDQKEVISQKGSMLTDYLEMLLRIPEIVVSDEILDFFDIGSVDGAHSAVDGLVTPMDVVLGNVPVTNKTVGKQFSVSLSVSEGNVVMWSFRTKNKDIGFSVEFNDIIVLPYQRHQSHQTKVDGEFEVTGPGTVVLIWDNSYSVMRSKLLEYSVKALPREEYAAAVEIAREAAILRQNNLQHRELLRTVLGQVGKDLLESMAGHGAHLMANKLSPVQSSLSLTTSDNPDKSASFSSNHSNESNSNLIPNSTMGCSGEMLDAPSIVNMLKTINASSREEMLEELAQLKDEKKSLQLSLIACEAALSEERAAVANSSDRMDDIVSSKESLEDEISQLTEELAVTRMELFQKQKLEGQMEMMKTEVAELLEQKTVLTAQLAKQKTEKKQLKTYALQLKSDLETAQLALQTKTHEMDLLVSSTSSDYEKIQTISAKYEESLILIEQLKSECVVLSNGMGMFEKRNEADSTENSLRNTTIVYNSQQIASEEADVDADDNDSPMASGKLLRSKPSAEPQLHSGNTTDSLHNHSCPEGVGDGPSPIVAKRKQNPFEPDVIDNIADSIVAEFKDMKEKAMEFLPSWEDLIKDEEDEYDERSGKRRQSSGDGSGIFFGF